MKTRSIAILLVIALVMSSLSGCGGSPAEKTGESQGREQAQEQPQALTLSPDKTAVTTSDGVTVDVGNYVLDGEAELTVTKQPVEENKEEGYKIEAYDISVGDLHELNDFITIRIPYDTSFCEEGQDPARCVGAKYKNETTGEWEDVLFEVDAAAKELVIYTDHLSYYGVFYVENEGRRNAYISDVLDSGLYMEPSAAYDFAKRIAEDDPTVIEELAKFGIEASDKFFDYSDRLDNAITMATVGDIPDWLNTEISGTNLTLFSAIGYIATCKSLMKVAIDDTVGSGADKGEILNLIRDVSSKVTAYWAEAFTSVGSAALSVSMGGVLIIDKMLTAFAEEAYSTKLEDISYVYHFYNERYSGGSHKPMTAKDWRAKAIEVIDKHPEDPEIAITALEAGFREYSSEFFALSYDEQCGIAGEVPEVTVKNLPEITQADQEKLTEDYIAHLKNDVMPGVLKSVENYMVKKVEQQQLQAINKVKDYYNTKIRITITEDVPEGKESAYTGYKFRFAPLNDTAVVGNWTGKWGGQPVNTSATLIGFMMAGLPHTIEFFTPDADMNTAEPEFVVPFVISIPQIDIEFGGGPVIDDLVGDYSGTVTFNAIRVTEETFRLYAQEGAGDYGVDMEFNSKADCDAALEQYIEDGQIAAGQELMIEKTGEDSCIVHGTIVNNSGDAFPMDVPAILKDGNLVLTTEEGTTQIKVTEEGGAITLSSDKAVFLIETEEDGVTESFLIDVSIDQMTRK